MFRWCINYTVDSQVQGLNIAFYLLPEKRHYTKIISQLFLQIKPIMTFSILNQYFKGPLFYRTSHQYFTYFNNLSFITEPNGACGTLVLKKPGQGGEGGQNLHHLRVKTHIFLSPVHMSARSWAQSQELTISNAPAVTLLPWNGRLVEGGLFCSPQY